MDLGDSKIEQIKEVVFTIPYGMTQSYISFPENLKYIEGMRIEGFGIEINLILIEEADASLEELLATAEQTFAEQAYDIQWSGARKTIGEAAGISRVSDTFKKDDKSYYFAVIQVGERRVFLTACYCVEDAFAASKVRDIVESIR